MTVGLQCPQDNQNYPQPQHSTFVQDRSHIKTHFDHQGCVLRHNSLSWIPHGYPASLNVP
jgi:hypothetical protein